MNMQIFANLEQGTEEWRRVRAGIPTASEFKCLLMNGRDGGDSKTRRSYLYRLAAEIITGEPCETFKSPAMERGNAMEDEARNFYALMHDIDPQRVGFVRNGDKGCSPDSLLGADGMLEIKTVRADLLVDVIFKGDFPPEHIAQCQGALWVCEREWIDLFCYWPNMPMFVKRAFRDENFIQRLSNAVDAFNEELALTVERLRAHRRAA